MSRSFVWVEAAAALAVAAVTLSCSGAGGGGSRVDAECDSGFHLCGGECLPDASPFSCGTSCTPCPAPDHGTATCTAGTCGVACPGGYHPCAGACFDDASPAHCGASCVACPAPAFAHATAACVEGACGYACDVGFVACDEGCCGGPAPGLGRVAAGAETTCGIDGAGVLVCWGHNMNGTVGDGSTETMRLSPVPVAGGHAVSRVAVGDAHACAIDAAGAAWCWGSGWAGQLGDGTTFGVGAVKRSPVAVLPLGAEALMVAAGWSHSCAQLANGAVKCWGMNEEGELGDGSLRTSSSPVTVSGVSAAGMYSGARFACAVTGLASMRCWGANDAGQLGSATAGDEEAAPVEVTNLAGVTRLRAVALGARHACVAYDGAGVSGGVRCWGAAPGNGRTETQRTGVEVTGPLVPIDGVVALDAGENHTCAVTASGALLCWGRNASGQLGDGTATSADRPTAFPVTDLGSSVLGVTAGGRHTCALVDAGGGTTALRCWGANDFGQLGDGTTTLRTKPTLVPGF